MEHYIPKSALVAEIKRRRKLVSDPILSGNDLMIGEKNALFNLLSFIDTLEVKGVQEEPASEDLAKNPELSGWVARDKDGNLHVFEVKPKRTMDDCRWWDRDYMCSVIDKNAFRDLKWEDEPVCVKLIIIKEDGIMAKKDTITLDGMAIDFRKSIKPKPNTRLYYEHQVDNAYVAGYRQAEKELELTWEDVKTIDRLLNQCVDYSNPYQEVLKRFKKGKI